MFYFDAFIAAISWLGFKDCDISADAGLRILTHYIGQLKLQVLAVEQCGLTDASLVYIASILKVPLTLLTHFLL
jgi:hypothetical protein